MMMNQFFFQNSASLYMLQLELFHNKVMMLIIYISVYIFLVFFFLLFNNYYFIQILNQNHKLEMLWTLIPILILIFVAFPSLRLLYMMEEFSEVYLTVKSVGHQWYWSYDYSDFKSLEFDSYMVMDNDLMIGEFRLLEVDNRLVLPYGVEIQMIINSEDVIHSWTIPVMGVKVDAVPGRLNQILMMTFQPGIFYGQCSEICGANHSFMPIVLESVDLISWENWVLMN